MRGAALPVLLSVASATLASVSAPSAAGRSSTAAPHLFVALVDDLGYSNVGFHNPKQRSPEIDRLAQVWRSPRARQLASSRPDSARQTGDSDTDSAPRQCVTH
jgi:hypothetical protein